jgi:general secretion pathway protein G
MKTLQSVSAIITLSAFVCLTGCKREEAPPTGQPGKPVTPAAVSATKTSFAQVTSQLDPGGSLYLYLSTEQFLSGLSGKTAAWRGALALIPDLKDEDRQNLDKAFDLVTNLIQKSGIEQVSGFGMSSIARETNLYHTKAILHHYAGQGSGLLWNMFGQKPHALNGLNLLPASTAVASISDLDAPMLWSVVQQQVSDAGLPQAEAALKLVPEKFEEMTGLKWDSVLASLGGEFGMAVTLDDTKVVPIPLGGEGDPLQIPEPGLLIIAKVKDETIFNRISEAMTKNGGQQIIKVDKPGLKMRTWPLPLPLPIQLRPTLATAEGYLFIATTDTLINDVLAAKSGQKPGLKSTAEFQRLAKDTPAQGNSFSFTSARFGQTMRKIQQASVKTGIGSQSAWLQSLISSGEPPVSYAVAANTDEGWLVVANGNQHPGKILAVSAIVPAGILAAVAVPNFVKARQTSQKSACIHNLRMIDGAKQQWALEKKKADTDVPTRNDLKPYLPKKQFPTCSAGGSYTLNAVSDKPECSIPGHKLGE